MKNHVSSSLKTILFLNHIQNTISIPTKKSRFFITKLRVLKKLESCSIDNIFSYAATPPFSFSGLSFLMSEKKRKLKKIFKLSGFKKSSNYHSINLVFKNNFSPKKFFFGNLPTIYANSCSLSFVQMRRQLKNSPLFLCLLVILQLGVTKTEKCPGTTEEEQEKLKKQIVDITLDPKRSVSLLY